MPRKQPDPPPPPSDRDAWVITFVDELQRLRPHTPIKLANTIGLGLYTVDVSPKKAAAAYHASQGGAAPPAARKRSK